jgi:hypothetical protein
VKPFTTAIPFRASLAIVAWPMRQALIYRGLAREPAAALLLFFSRDRRFAGPRPSTPSEQLA